MKTKSIIVLLAVLLLAAILTGCPSPAAPEPDPAPNPVPLQNPDDGVYSFYLTSCHPENYPGDIGILSEDLKTRRFSLSTGGMEAGIIAGTAEEHTTLNSLTLAQLTQFLTAVGLPGETAASEAAWLIAMTSHGGVEIRSGDWIYRAYY